MLVRLYYKTYYYNVGKVILEHLSNLNYIRISCKSEFNKLLYVRRCTRNIRDACVYDFQFFA